MIYDRVLRVYTLAPGSSPVRRQLDAASAVDHCYAEMEVYAARYYQGRQAGVTITRMVAVPRPDDDTRIEADQYVIPEDGRVYRIAQAQYDTDDNGLPVTTLSLAEPEGKYELYKT